MDKTEILPRFPVSLVTIGVTTSIVFSALACSMIALIPVANDVTSPAVIRCIDIPPERRTGGGLIVPSPYEGQMAFGSSAGVQRVSTGDHVAAEIPAGDKLGLVPGDELRIAVVGWSGLSKPEVQGRVTEVKPSMAGGGPSEVLVTLLADGAFDRICRQSQIGAVAATIKVCCNRQKLINAIVFGQSK